MIAINDKSGVKCGWDQKHFQIIIFLQCNASFSKFKEKKTNTRALFPGILNDSYYYLLLILQRYKK